MRNDMAIANETEDLDIPDFLKKQNPDAGETKDATPNILQQADEITSYDRNKDYGHPKENFGLIAKFWEFYIDYKKTPGITPRDVAMMNILTKVAREANAPKEDNLVDIAGYARTAEMIGE